MIKKDSKMFVVRKYVMARTVKEALRKEPKTDVHEVFVDDEWRKNRADRLSEAVGFYLPKTEEEE